MGHEGHSMTQRRVNSLCWQVLPPSLRLCHTVPMLSSCAKCVAHMHRRNTRLRRRKALEGSDESARVSSRGRLATSLLAGVALVPCEAAEGSELSPPMWLGLASCQYTPAASSCIKRFNASVGEGLGFGDEDFPRPRRTARPPWWKCACSAEALAAAPAAKDVDAKENENGAIDTCHQSEKTRGGGPGAPRPPLSAKTATPGNGEF